MNYIETFFKEYSTLKLKEIIDLEADSYADDFIDYIKDELIRRGEKVEFSEKSRNEITNMNDADLKSLVEYEWYNYHLEYMECARREYIKRGFKNTLGESDVTEPITERMQRESYSFLKMVVIILKSIALLAIFGPIVLSLVNFTMFSITILLYGVFSGIATFIVATFIEVVLKIERNTRKD